MTSHTPDASRLYLGIDGGGSKCRALLTDATGRTLGCGISGPANPFQNLEQACDSITRASTEALAQAGLGGQALGGVIAGVGLAGVNIPRVYEQMSLWSNPFAALYLTTDIHIACLGAHGGEDGAVIVVGTGSVGYVCERGDSHSYGAHGFPFGDKASGAWLGLEGLKAALLCLDGLGPQTALLAATEAHLHARGLNLVAAMAGARSRDYGALAPVVLACAEAGDAVATAIMEEAAAYLDALAAKLFAHGAERFALLGGLGQRLVPWLSPESRAAVIAAQGQPDEGAVSYAMARHSAAVNRRVS
ncbi:ATPase [Parahaliea maris]|uniref:ATPase n=1 Tax=Parahaliea maris TaxID=2716870 RepID=A0A5C8ZMT5_9GAMM|nr:BadF/BadG/BcrA/BcrD ATPase family protein [Parahaliea maris]TXS89816.1 ATPase [Parahaliea maris]